MRPGKKEGCFDFIFSYKCSICFLQEVHLRDGGDAKTFTREWGRGEAVWSVGGVHSTGVGILFGERDFFVENVYTIVQGRVVAADVNFRDLKFRVVGGLRSADCCRKEGDGGQHGTINGH